MYILDKDSNQLQITGDRFLNETVDFTSNNLFP